MSWRPRSSVGSVARLGEFRLLYGLLSHEELSARLSLMWWGCVKEKLMMLGSGDRSLQFLEVREYIAGENLAQGMVSLFWWGLVLVSVSCRVPVTLGWWLSQGCRQLCCTGEWHPACPSAPAWRGWSSAVGGSWNEISCPLATSAKSLLIHPCPVLMNKSLMLIVIRVSQGGGSRTLMCWFSRGLSNEELTDPSGLGY